MESALKNLTLLLVGKKLEDRFSKKDFKEIYFAKDGDEGLKKFKKFNPNIVITNINLPIKDGFSMIEEIKEFSNNSLIIIISEASEKNLLRAIEVGVDKFISSSASIASTYNDLKELVKRKLNKIVKIDSLNSFDLITKKFIKNGVEIPLTKKELAFISLLANKNGTLVLHDDIKKNVWINEKVSDAAIRTFVKRVRDKIGGDYILNIPGLGYKLNIEK